MSNAIKFFIMVILIPFSVKDFKDYNPFQENFDALSATTENDLILEENHEGSLPTTAFSSSSENIAQIKINKYQGLDNFFKQVIDAEKKKELPAEINPQKLPGWKKKAAAGLKALLGLKEKPQEGLIAVNVSEKMPLEEEQKSTNLMDSKLKSDYLKNKRIFNKSFPPKKLKKTQSMPKLEPVSSVDEDFEEKMPGFAHRFTILRPGRTMDGSFEKEKEGKNKRLMNREMSFKVSGDCKAGLEFLENIRHYSIEYEKELILENIKKKLENELKAKEEEEEKVSILGKCNGPWGEPWDRKTAEIMKNSPFGHFPSWQIRNIIIKGGDDLRQELIAMQMIIKFKQIFDEAGLKLFLRPYDIMVTSPDSGILGIYN